MNCYHLSAFPDYPLPFTLKKKMYFQTLPPDVRSCLPKTSDGVIQLCPQFSWNLPQHPFLSSPRFPHTGLFRLLARARARGPYRTMEGNLGEDKIGCCEDFRKIWRRSWMTQKGKKEKRKLKNSWSIIRMNSGVLRVARGCSGAEAPPLAARPVPRNGRGPRLVEVTNGC